VKAAATILVLAVGLSGACTRDAVPDHAAAHRAMIGQSITLDGCLTSGDSPWHYRLERVSDGDLPAPELPRAPSARDLTRDGGHVRLTTTPSRLDGLLGRRVRVTGVILGAAEEARYVRGSWHLESAPEDDATPGGPAAERPRRVAPSPAAREDQAVAVRVQRISDLGDECEWPAVPERPR
jgi:hypothetical protein